MKILLFHPCALPPRDYGGVERVVLWLSKGLLERGHEVTVAALEGSVLPYGVRLLPVSPKNRSAEILLKALPKGTQCVHFMAPPEQGVLEKLNCAGVVTIHGNGKTGESFPLNSVFLSQNHARRHGAQSFVYNGIDPSEYLFEPQKKKDAYLFLSKTSWKVKNLAGAAEFCESARVPIWIAGGNRPYTLRAELAVKGFFRKNNAQWFGPVAGKKKAQLLAHARALVFPVLWDEPFGLVMVEALISGTPVLAHGLGSVPELITPDVGRVFSGVSSAQDKKEWIDQLREFSMKWDPEVCRQRAIQKFHYSVMAQQYESVYQLVSSGAKLHASVPQTLN